MFSEVDMWFYKHLAGIQITEEGLTIAPCFVPEIGYVKANHHNISVYWDNKVLKVHSPTKFTLKLKGKPTLLDPGSHEFNL